jgi:hypothetical protein
VELRCRAADRFREERAGYVVGVAERAGRIDREVDALEWKSGFTPDVRPRERRVARMRGDEIEPGIRSWCRTGARANAHD